MKTYLKTAMPFSALGTGFIIIGLVLADSKHIYFGLVGDFGNCNNLETKELE